MNRKSDEKEVNMMESKEISRPIDTPEGREWLQGLLRTNVVTISFVKKDGSERKMRCTLGESKIPSEKTPKNAGRAKSEDAIAVFDIEKQDWRSFRFDSVKMIEFDVSEVV
jgi:hypothetical protein